MYQSIHGFGRECRICRGSKKKESFRELKPPNENLRAVTDVKQLQTGEVQRAPLGLTYGLRGKHCGSGADGRVEEGQV